MGFSKKGYWCGLPFPSLGDLPDPEIKPVSHALQVDFLLSELPEKSKSTGMGSLSCLQGNLTEPGIKPGSPGLQAASLPAELPGNPI